MTADKDDKFLDLSTHEIRDDLGGAGLLKLTGFQVGSGTFQREADSEPVKCVEMVVFGVLGLPGATVWNAWYTEEGSHVPAAIRLVIAQSDIPLIIALLNVNTIANCQ